MSDEDLLSLSDALSGADLFITEETLRHVYERPDADLVTFMRHILGLEGLLTRRDQISTLFDQLFGLTLISLQRRSTSCVRFVLRRQRREIDLRGYGKTAV